MLNQKPGVVDLEMTDTEYLELLSQGRNPVQEQLYRTELIAYGFTLDDAKHLAPLFDKGNSTIAEKILVSRTLKQIWEKLLNAARDNASDRAITNRK